MHEQQNQEELDLRSYFRPIWRRKWIVLAVVVLATAGTYFISSRQAKEYQASTELYVQVADPTVNLANSNSTSYGGPLANEQLGDVAQLITAQAVTNGVSRAIGKSAAEAGTVTASPSTTSDFVTVTGTSHDPVMAARLVNTYILVFLNQRRQAVASVASRDAQGAKAALHATPNTAANASQRTTLLGQIASLEQIAANPAAGAYPVATAAVPDVPSSPKPKRNAIFGGLVGLVLAIIVAFCLELLDRRLLRISTVEAIFRRPVLGVLPHVPDPTPLVKDDQATVPVQFLEELRSLRVMLRLAGDKPPRTIIVTSALPREGKSTIVRDLALVYAEAGERALVIDADLRRPAQERMFGLHSHYGLVQVLDGRTSLAQAVVQLSEPHASIAGSANGHVPAETNGRGSATAADPHGAVDVLVAGQTVSNPVALLSSERIRELLEEARSRYDVILVDTAPVLTVADSVPLLEMVDAVLVVTRLGETTRQTANRLTDLIDRLSGINFMGVIANDRREHVDDEGYGSYGRYGYGYYHEPELKGSSPPAAVTARERSTTVQ